MDLIEHLRRIPIFGRLGPEALMALAEMIDWQVLSSGTRLVRQADLGATFYVIDFGEAVVHRVDERGLQRPVGMITADDYFGVTSLFLGEPRDATITAVTEMGVWTLRRQDFEAFLAEHPEVRRSLVIPRAILTKLSAPRYPWLEPGEFVAAHCRRHWIVFARAMLFMTTLVIAYLALIVWLASSADLRLALLILPIMIVYASVFAWRWFNWRNDYFAVTTHRATHRERVAFVYESRNEVPLDRVQNINLVTRGLGQILGYGVLTIETAADVGTMVFDNIPHPETVRDAIWSQIARAQATRRASQRHLIRQTLASHMDIDAGEPDTELDMDQEQPVDLIETAPPKVLPGKLTRMLMWLAEQDIVPRVRIETEDSVTWRKHWIFLFAEIALPLFLSVLLSVSALLGFFGIPAQLAVYSLYPLVLLLAAVVCLGWLWWQYNDWGNDLYIVTNERLIDIEKRPLFFSEERREASLGMIQNVSLRIPNITASLLNYGVVVVQTAGAGDFTFDQVSNPRAVQTEIFKRMQAFREAQREREASRRRAELAEWFSVYDELMQDRPRPQSDEPLSEDDIARTRAEED